MAREKIGNMRHRVTLQTYTYTQNEYGERVPGYTNLATVWAEVQYESGTENEDAKRQTAQISITVTLRYRADFLDEKNRLFWRDRAYNIRAIEPDSHLRYMTIRAFHQLT